MTTDSIEQGLLKGLAQNERKAVETIYRNHYRMVQSLVVNNSGTSDDARDVFQEALIVLYEKARSGSFELHAQLKTYIYAVCRRLWLKRLQVKQKFSADLASAGETVSVTDDVDIYEHRSSDYELMEMALQNLGEPCKALLESYYLQKKNMSEIAKEFGYTNADNAKNQKYKCLMRLKKIFFSQYKNP
ncbi:MAG: sigma-70 family RNA polymerase sigma factor [Bacteroidota bacterium]|nr:sigma-70 family RNA polymerase sigma factor [Bacteroidota bacterium]MDP4250380.1 sigma-70 family RNA polymerase sigma factor [Bacteroidota bacterium]